MTRFILANDQVRYRAVTAVQQALQGYVVTIKPPTRSLEQNAKLHAELTEIAATVPWAGKLRDVTTWKRLLTASWLRARGEAVEVLPALDGHGIDVIFEPTSQMTGAQVRELLDYIGAWRSEWIDEARAGLERVLGPNVGIEPPYSVGSNDGLGPNVTK
jgi:hypothetical protein